MFLMVTPHESLRVIQLKMVLNSANFQVHFAFFRHRIELYKIVFFFLKDHPCEFLTLVWTYFNFLRKKKKKRSWPTNAA